MRETDRTFGSMEAEADRLGKEQAEIDRKNKRRAAKGKPPLPDKSELEEMAVLKRRYRSGAVPVVSGNDVIKLFEMRMEKMEGDSDYDQGDEPVSIVGATAPSAPASSRAAKAKPPAREKKASRDEGAERAVREAEAARREQDVKNGRIDHDGNWGDGQRLEGGDRTSLLSGDDFRKAVDSLLGGPADWNRQDQPQAQQAQQAQQATQAPNERQSPTPPPTPSGQNALDAFRADLYERLRVSFASIEASLSYLQGRVAEIVTATTPDGPGPASEEEGEGEKLRRLLETKTPVEFGVGGARMAFDAVCVFYEAPCITVVSRFGSARFVPKPGSKLTISFETPDGEKYSGEEVVYLGTRFELPMFGLSFLGFVKISDAGMIDAEAGLPPEE